MANRYFFIVNPHSASRRTGHIWPHIKELFEKRLGKIDFALTKGNVHATYLTGEALYAGYDRIIVVGGDGTLNEAVNGFYDSNGIIKKDAVLGYFASGTGEDFARTFKIEALSVEAHVERILRDNITRIDVGNVQYLKPDGSANTRKFINETSAGFTANVARTVNVFPKFLNGKLTFLLGTLASFAVFRRHIITVKADGKEVFSGKALAVCAANGKYFGGSMKIAPEASPDDGLFDIIILKDIGRIELMRNIGIIYDGGHMKNPKIMALKAKEVVLTSHDNVGIEMDGEPVGHIGAKISIHERELGFIV